MEAGERPKENIKSGVNKRLISFLFPGKVKPQKEDTDSFFILRAIAAVFTYL